MTCTRGQAGGDRLSDASRVGSELVFDDCGGMQSVRVVDRSRTESRRMSEVRLVRQVSWAERGGLILVWMKRTASRDRGGCEKCREVSRKGAKDEVEASRDGLRKGGGSELGWLGNVGRRRRPCTAVNERCLGES